MLDYYPGRFASRVITGRGRLLRFRSTERNGNTARGERFGTLSSEGSGCCVPYRRMQEKDEYC
jgi:hypothetical protein